jgi:hypothetical protein
MQSVSVNPTSDSESSRTPLVAESPASLVSERHGEVTVVRLAWPQKRNALDSETVSGVERPFSGTPETAVRSSHRTPRDVSNPWICEGLRLLIKLLYR